MSGASTRNSLCVPTDGDSASAAVAPQPSTNAGQGCPLFKALIRSRFATAWRPNVPEGGAPPLSTGQSPPTSQRSLTGQSRHNCLFLVAPKWFLQTCRDERTRVSALRPECRNANHFGHSTLNGKPCPAYKTRYISTTFTQTYASVM